MEYYTIVNERMYYELIDYLDENTEIIWTITGDLKKVKFTNEFNRNREIIIFDSNNGTLSSDVLDNFYKYFYYEDECILVMFKEFIKKCEKYFPNELDNKKQNIQNHPCVRGIPIEYYTIVNEGMYNKLIDYLDENTEIVWTTTGDLKTKYTTTFNDKIEVLFLNNDTGSLSVTSLENLYKYYYDDRYLFLMFKEFIKKCEELFPK